MQLSIISALANYILVLNRFETELYEVAQNL